MKLSIVVPILNEHESIPVLRDLFEKTKSSLELEGHKVEIILNDNQSTDGSTEILKKWASEDSSAIHQLFEKRLTFQQSIIFGFRRATGDCVAVYQGDLQDPWELIEVFFRRWLEGNKVIVGVAVNKHNTFLQHISRKAFYSFLKQGSTSNMTVGFQDFYLLDQTVYKSISSKPNQFQFIRGAIARDYKVDCIIDYKRSYRMSGKSKFRFSDKYDLALDGLLVHSQAFTRKLSVLGVSISVLSAASLLLIGVLWLVKVDFGVSGWLSTVALLSFFIGLFSFSTSIQLEFLRRILSLASERTCDHDSH